MISDFFARICIGVEIKMTEMGSSEEVGRTLALGPLLLLLFAASGGCCRSLGGAVSAYNPERKSRTAELTMIVDRRFDDSYRAQQE